MLLNNYLLQVLQQSLGSSGWQTYTFPGLGHFLEDLLARSSLKARAHATDVKG